jgi:hypothetical protein
MSRLICVVFLSLTLVTTCAEGQPPNQPKFPPDVEAAIRNRRAVDNLRDYSSPAADTHPRQEKSGPSWFWVVFAVGAIVMALAGGIFSKAPAPPIVIGAWESPAGEEERRAYWRLVTLVMVVLAITFFLFRNEIP